MGIINRAVKKVLNNKIKEAEQAYKEDIINMKEQKRVAINNVLDEADRQLKTIKVSHEADKEQTLSKHVTGILSKII